MRYHVEITIPVVIDATDEEAARCAASGLADHLLDLAELDADVSRPEDPAAEPTVGRTIQALDDEPDTQAPAGFQPGDRVSWTVVGIGGGTSELTGTITKILDGARDVAFAEITYDRRVSAQSASMPVHLLTRLDAQNEGTR